MKRDFDTALDQCIARMREGRSIASCVAQYPEHADDLRPLLEMVPHVVRATLPEPSSASRAAGKQQMLDTLARKHERQSRMTSVARYLRRWAHVPRLGGRWSMSLGWRAVAVLLVVAACAASGLAVHASTSTIPGDALYPVKLSSQQLQLRFTVNPIARDLLQGRFDTQRRSDVQAAMGKGRQVKVEFQGVLQQVEGNVWSVGGLPVTLQETEVLVDNPPVGTLLCVTGNISEVGLLLATEITEYHPQHPHPTETPEPTKASPISPTTPPIRTEGPTVTTSPTKASETPSRSSARTATPEPSETPELIAEPEPTDAPHPTIWPESREESDHTEKHEATEAPEATEKPEQIQEPESTESPDLTETPQPTPTLDREETEEDTDDPVLTETPKPSD